MEMEAAEILRKPYARQVVPQPDGVFKAEILEFPGCFAIGDTAIDALAILEEVAADWIVAAVEQGQEIPEPTEHAGYSGKLGLRMSKTLHKKVAQFSMRDGVSINQFIVNCLAEHVGLLARPAVQRMPRPMLHLSLQVDSAWAMVPLAPTGGAAMTGSAVQLVARRYEDEFAHA
jgi:antitoxin HicB